MYLTNENVKVEEKATLYNWIVMLISVIYDQSTKWTSVPW